MKTKDVETLIAQTIPLRPALKQHLTPIPPAGMTSTEITMALLVKSQVIALKHVLLLQNVVVQEKTSLLVRQIRVVGGL